MKPFHDLSDGARFRRLRRLADQAVVAFGLGSARLRPLVCWENATWRVSCAQGELLLRVHRVGYRSREEVLAELRWLEHLRGCGLPVAQPYRLPDGTAVVEADAPGVPGPRLCTLLTWVHGRIHRRPTLPAVERIGRLFAQLHNAAESAPSIGPRPAFDDTGWFRPAIPSGVPGVDAALSSADRHLIGEMQHAAHGLFARLDRSPASWGHIHADLHFFNVVHTPSGVVPIDFDDMGTGPFLYDLAIPYIRCSRLADPAKAWARLLKGYRSLRPLTDAQEADVRALAVLQMPGVLRYIASRWPDPEVVSLLPRVLDDIRRVWPRWCAQHPWPFVSAS